MLLGRKRFDFDISEKVLKKNKIPVLLEHEPWKRCYSISRSKDMEKWYGKLFELVKENSQVKKSLSQMQSQKRSIMAKIVFLSRELNENSNGNANDELDGAKADIEMLNEKIDYSYERLEELPSEIENANMELLKSTIKHVYENISADESKLKRVNETIEEKRAELDILRKERDELGFKVDSMYSFMHNTVGSKEMEKLDKKFFK